MKKIIFIICMFLLSINIFANTDVTKQVEKIREEFTKINSEKNYKVENVEGPGSEKFTEYYRKNKQLKKVVEYYNIPSAVTTIQYYLKGNEVFFVYEVEERYKQKETGEDIKIGETQRRYYFDKGNLIRYIEDGKIYDKGKIPKKYIEDAGYIPKTLSELEEIRQSALEFAND